MYQSLKEDTVKENLQAVRNEINEQWIIDKIEHHIERFNLMYSVPYIQEQIMKDDIVASCFCKSPLKQNLGEKAIIEYFAGYPQFEKLPPRGKNAIWFDSNGDVCAKSTAKTKSADFVYRSSDDGEVYITQKYTVGEGGAQDAAFLDVSSFLCHGSKKHKVTAILDGTYWTEAKRKHLKELNGSVDIYTADEFMNFIQQGE